MTLLTITVTESGYYTDMDGNLDLTHAIIAAEVAGDKTQSVYGYLQAALNGRRTKIDEPITISCCDNIRQNGHVASQFTSLLNGLW